MAASPANPRDDSSSLGDFKSQVLGATDIVDLIGRTVSLKKRGKDHVGLCPFHTEKSPSFHVSQSKQFFYCYGCKAGGDAISFVKLRDRVEFMDALKSLATDAGIPIPRFGRGRPQDVTETQICLDANSLSAMFFEQMLADGSRGKAAREYIASRGINDETTRKFRIGFAPEGWDNLLRGPVGKKFQPGQLHLAGLAKQRDPEKGQGYYDVFRNRLMFPIRDPNGRVIAFGGRVMPGSQDPAKYLNSPETPVFSKGKALYGLDLARQRIVETQTAVIVEGYTDVVMAHQFGATNVVATLGTAMTEQHVTLLRRFAGRIVLLFDPDVAGDIAVDRAVALFLSQPVEIAIANLGEDLDPDEFLLKYGLERFEKLIAEAPGALAFKWKHLVRTFAADANNLTGQQKAIEAYLDVVGQAKQSGPVDPIRWGLMVSQISKLTGIPAEQIQRRVSMVRAGPKKPFMPVAGPSGQPPSRPALEPRRKSSVLSARILSERRLLGALLLWPERWGQVQAVVGVEDFQDSDHRRLAEVYWNHQRDEGEPVFGEFLALLAPTSGTGETDLRELAMACVDDIESLGEVESVFDTAVSDMLACLSKERELQEKRKLVTDLERKKTEGRDDQAEQDLLRKMMGMHDKKPGQKPPDATK